MHQEKAHKLDLEEIDISILASNATERDWRSKPTLHEPGTVDWLRSMRQGACLFDIGANVGVFTLIAAQFGRADFIVAVEPAPENVWRLHQNLDLNQLSENVCVISGAVAEKSGIGTISSDERLPGSSAHMFTWLGSENARTVPCFSLDDLIFAFGAPAPTHIKIDVDGAEAAVLAGASRLLADGQIESINIEVDAWAKPAEEIHHSLLAAGFEFAHAYFDPLAAEEEPDDIKIENRIYNRGSPTG